MVLGLIVQKTMTEINIPRFNYIIKHVYTNTPVLTNSEFYLRTDWAYYYGAYSPAPRLTIEHIDQITKCRYLKVNCDSKIPYNKLIIDAIIKRNFDIRHLNICRTKTLDILSKLLLSCNNLMSLSLEGCIFGKNHSDMRALETCLGLRTLRYLSISHTTIMHRYMPRFTTLISNLNLELIEFTACTFPKITPNDYLLCADNMSILNAVFSSQISHVNFSWCHNVYAGEKIESVLANNFHLISFSLEARKPFVVAQAFCNGLIRNISLQNISMSLSIALNFNGIFKDIQNLRYLKLYGLYETLEPKFTEDYVSQFYHYRNLTHLLIKMSTEIPNANHLFDILRNNNILQHFDLYCEKMSMYSLREAHELSMLDRATNDLSNCLKNNHSLEYLSIYCYCISSTCIRQLISGLRTNNTLQHLHIKCYRFSAEFDSEVSVYLRNNRALKTLQLPVYARTAESLISIVDLITTNHVIENLNFEIQCLNEAVVTTLITALIPSKIIHSIKLSIPHLASSKIFDEIARLVQYNQSLHYLSLDFVQSAGVILDAFRYNKSICDLTIHSGSHNLGTDASILNEVLNTNFLLTKIDMMWNTPSNEDINAKLNRNQKLAFRRKSKLIEMAAKCYADTHRKFPDPEFVPTEVSKLLEQNLL